MLRFLKPSTPNDAQEPPDDNRLILDEFSTLDQHRQDEVAEKLAVLWQCFIDEFGDPASFHDQPQTTQDAYIAKFERMAARSTPVRHSASGHLHYSVALMLRFLLIARDGARQQSALDLSGTVAALVNRARDRESQARRTFLVDAISASLEPPEVVNTQVIVDHSMEFHPRDPLRAGQASENVRPQPDGTSAGRGTTVIYMREGERWTRRRRRDAPRHDRP